MQPPVAMAVVNGVDTASMSATLDAMSADPQLAAFQFRATNHWINGTHSRATIGSCRAGQQTITRRHRFTIDSGEPRALLGTDTGPSPAELLLAALAACLTSSLVYLAAANGTTLVEVTSVLDGDMDVRGAFGLDEDCPKGFSQIRVRLTVKGNASDHELRELVARAQQRSGVFDMVTNGVPVSIEVTTDGASTG